MDKDDLKEFIDPETGEILSGIPLFTKEEIVEEKGDITLLLEIYTSLDLQKSEVLSEIVDFREKHKDILEGLSKLEESIALIEENQDKVKEDLKIKMREEDCREEVGLVFTAKYTPSYTRKKFNTDQFYTDYPEDTAMYKKYVTTTDVADSIRIVETKKK